MKNKSHSKSVPVQKGEIVADQPTMKHKPYVQGKFEDLLQNRQIHEGQSLTLMTPKH